MNDGEKEIAERNWIRGKRKENEINYERKGKECIRGIGMEGRDGMKKKEIG